MRQSASSSNDQKRRFCITDGKSESVRTRRKYTGATIRWTAYATGCFLKKFIRGMRRNLSRNSSPRNTIRSSHRDEQTEAPLIIGRASKRKISLISAALRSHEFIGDTAAIHFSSNTSGVTLALARSEARCAGSVFRSRPAAQHQVRRSLVKTLGADGVRAIHAAAVGTNTQVHLRLQASHRPLSRERHPRLCLDRAFRSSSQKILVGHPEWREKNVFGQDGRPAWRYPLANHDAACMDAVIGKLRDFLQRFDFDGVNFGRDITSNPASMDRPIRRT